MGNKIIEWFRSNWGILGFLAFFGFLIYTSPKEGWKPVVIILGFFAFFLGVGYLNEKVKKWLDKKNNKPPF